MVKTKKKGKKKEEDFNMNTGALKPLQGKDHVMIPNQTKLVADGSVLKISGSEEDNRGI